ncbi:hypothetical protein ACOTVP_08820 [Aliarcobacter butzleri]
MKKFSNEFWLEVRKDFDAKMPQSELRKKYDLSKGALGNKIKRDNWNLQTVEELQNKIIIKTKDKPIKKKEPKAKKEVNKILTKLKNDIPKDEPKQEDVSTVIEKPKKTSDEKIYEEYLSTVKTLLIANVEHSRIASIIGVSEQVFERLFYEEIENALILADAEVLNSIYVAATDIIKPNPQCQKLWIELQAKRKEKEDKEVVEVNPFAMEFQAPKSK